MKQLFSILLAGVLSAAVAGSLAGGTLAVFSDTELSDKNAMHAGSVILELSGEHLAIDSAVPDKWYSVEKTLTNAGTLDAVASAHINDLVSQEDAPGAGIATSEPELVAEEGGKVGQTLVAGLGVDIHNLEDFIDIKLWFDTDGDGQLELITQGKLADLVSQVIVLGTIPAAAQGKGGGGGWASYFEYFIGGPQVTMPLVAGQNNLVGSVSVRTDSARGLLVVTYDTSGSGWTMAETHLYVDDMAPTKLSPGAFPYKHDPLTPPATTDVYELPLIWSGKVFIAAHATGTDGETAWATGNGRRFKLEARFPDIPEADLGLDYFDESDPHQRKWDHWPTNAYQGDRVTFDIEFRLNSGPGP